MSEVRIRNLRTLMKGHPSQNAFAEACHQDKGAMSAMLNGQQTIGPKRARSIEDSLGIDKGWLDEDHGSEQHAWLQAACASLGSGADGKAAVAAANVVVKAWRGLG